MVFGDHLPRLVNGLAPLLGSLPRFKGMRLKVFESKATSGAIWTSFQYGMQKLKLGS
jgi:hypothetical protein